MCHWLNTLVVHHHLIKCAKCAQMLSNVPLAQLTVCSSSLALPNNCSSELKCSQMLTNAHKMLSNALKCSQMHSNALKCTQMLSNALKYTQMHSNILKCTQIHSDVHKCSQMHSNALKYTQNTQMLTNVPLAQLPGSIGHKRPSKWFWQHLLHFVHLPNFSAGQSFCSDAASRIGFVNTSVAWIAS